ncbi:hypothetical protein KH5H1_72530 [Corallococcus caeni]|uniref:Uncharacterized protein n=1 Tax=Corallococcus exercitus TaxID=2316736 RepID=A0A7Y4JVP2_9BACT|nr:hypothetical protein [Corallococcus exercitus]NOK11939.1 hypothetical protein [Corallococcus exercitus]GMU03132.1 hypothetical protein KH5H1_72530 [Corallococcus sp. KH5-1]
MTNPDWLEAAAERGAREPDMLGSVFAWYRDLEDLSVQAFAQKLGCTVETLHWVSLCRRPEGAAFSEHVNQIAEHFGIDGFELSRVLRDMEATAALIATENSPLAPEARAVLLAARDREKKS